MAAGIIPAPGSEYGPCAGLNVCDHRDCARIREMAKKRCKHCGESIGYSTRFYQDGDELEHAICLEEKIEKERS